MANDNQQQTVTITMALGNAILTHLKNGGNRLEADMLAEHLVNQSNAPAVEAARQREIRDAVAQANIDAALKAGGEAPTAVPEPEMPEVPAAEVKAPRAVAARRARR